MKTTKILAIIAIALVAVSNLSAQTISASKKYTFAPVINAAGDTTKVDLTGGQQADIIGGRPHDLIIGEDGKAKFTFITGWAVGATGGMNSYGGAVYGGFVKNYFGWGHIALNAEVSEKMEIDKDLNQQFRSLGASVDFAISIAHFGGKKSVNTTGMSSYQAVKALRNERYGRSWRLYAGPSVGYQYSKNNTHFQYTDPDPDVDVPGTVDFPSVKDGSSVKYGAVIGLEKRFFNSITKVSLEGRCESYNFKSFGKSYNPLYGSVTVRIEFGLGRRPNKGKF